MLFCSSAQASDRRELTEIIASCAGRISAELEFAWLFSDPEANNFETQRSHFLDILDALTEPEDAKLQLALRVDAKMAHARLLRTAHFGSDVARSTWAKRHAYTQRAECQNILLKS